jgi:hypothetical protein
MFHYPFPPLTIGMRPVLVYLEAMHLRTGEDIHNRAARFWTGIFALTFTVGVASGIVMEFQFGTNWAIYWRFVGDVFGSALAAEGIFAFFLESGFLAALVFGWDRVSPKMHFFSTCMVALGAVFSSIWIVVATAGNRHQRDLLGLRGKSKARRAQLLTSAGLSFVCPDSLGPEAGCNMPRWHDHPLDPCLPAQKRTGDPAERDGSTGIGGGRQVDGEAKVGDTAEARLAGCCLS